MKRRVKAVIHSSLKQMRRLRTHGKVSEELRATKELLESFLANTTDGVIIIDLDGKVLAANRAFETLHGWTRDEVIGKILPMTPPHLMNEAKQLHDQVLAGKSVNGVETYKLRKDGSQFHASVTISPIKDQDGDVIALAGVERDITEQKAAAKELQESEQRYRQLVEFSPEPIIVFTDYRIVYANPAAVHLLGADEIDGLIGKSVVELVHPDHAQDLLPQVEQLLREGKPSDMIQRKLFRLDKQVMDVEVTAVPIHYLGKPSIQLLCRDITERKKAEASLLEAQNLYKGIVEEALVGVYLYQEGKIVYVNRYLADMFGYTQEEMLQLECRQLVVEEDLAALGKQAGEALVDVNATFHFNVRGIKKNHDILFLEGSSSYTTYKGKPAIHGTVQDVTFKKAAEDSLRDSAQRYQRVIKFLPEPIVVIDMGMIIYANNSAMKLVRAADKNELEGRSIFDFIHPDHHQDTMQDIRCAMQTDEPTSFQERTILCCDGQLIEVEISSIRIHNYMGRTVVLSVLRDLTDRKRSEELLIRSEKLSAVGQLAAGVAHEIRNPLTSLKGFVQLLKSQVEDKSFYFDIMFNELERINLIVNEFMTLAKPHFTKFIYQRADQILQSVVSILETQAILTNVNISTEFDESLPSVYCDENQLKQVFLNIIKNAIEAMPQGGNVTITAKKAEPNHICIQIKDEGNGIPDAILLKIGEPFFTTKEKGTGLGLMISHRIIEMHRGSLHISSSRNGGTTVEIILPVPDKWDE